MGNYYGVVWSYGNELEHHGIKGQRWGVRRYQNEDGTLTPEGKERYTYTTGLPGERKMSLVGRIKFGNKYSNEFNAQNKYKGNPKKYEEEERKKFDEMTEEENKMRELGKRMNSFDKASPDEKLKIIEEVDEAQTKLLREKGSGNADFEGLNDWFLQNRSKAGEAKFNAINSMPKGPERDKQLTQLLKESDQEGQDSIYVNALIDHMQKTHGDFLSGTYKNEASKKIISDLDKDTINEEETRNNYFQQDIKRGVYPKNDRSSWLHRDKLAEDHPEVKRAMKKRESTWQKYCEQVLKDMGMPVNSDTIEYIQSVIIWN